MARGRPAGLSFKDHENELGSASFFLDDGATEVPSDLIDAIKAVQVEDTVTKSYVTVEVWVSPQPSAAESGEMQRNKKWLVSAHTEDDGLPVTFTIGGADFTKLPAGKKELDLTDGVGKDLKDAIEANCKSNRNEAIIVDRISASGN